MCNFAPSALNAPWMPSTSFLKHNVCKCTMWTSIKSACATIFSISPWSGAYVEGCFVITLLLSKNGGDYLNIWIPAQGYTQAGNFQLGPQNWQCSHKVWQQLGNKEAIEICAHDILYLQWAIFNLTFSHKVFLHVTIFIAPYGKIMWVFEDATLENGLISRQTLSQIL